MSTRVKHFTTKEEDLPVATPVADETNQDATMLKGNEADLLVISAEQLDEIAMTGNKTRKCRKKKKTVVMAGVATGVIGLVLLGPIAGILTGIAGACVTKNMIKHSQESKFQVPNVGDKQRKAEETSCFPNCSPH